MKQQVKISKVKGNPSNPRIIKNDKFKKLVKSIQEFPEMLKLRPIVVDEDFMVLGGNMRLKASKDAGLSEVWIDIAEGLTEEQKKEFIVKDNVGFGEWEWDILANEWDSVQLAEWGLDVWENEDDKVTEGLIEDDEIPEVKESIVKRGDIWQLGEHRVMCGDSTSSDDVEKLMNGEKADMVFTSPPYNANANTGDGDIFNKKKSKKMYEGAFSDNQSSDSYITFTKNVLDICFNFTTGFIFWNVSYNAKSRFEYIKQLEDKIENLIEMICWKKSSTIPFKGSMMRDWEPIFLFSTNGEKLNLKKVTSNYWDVNNTNSQGENHKACFPVGLPEKAIEMVVESKLILDPFLGSGTTLIAAEKTKRKCYGMELDEKYCDVIINRWEQFTGLKATIINGTK